MFGKLFVALEKSRLMPCRPIGLATLEAQYFSKCWFLSQSLLSGFTFLSYCQCCGSEPWAAAGSHWLKNGLFTLHFFLNAPIKTISFSTCTTPKQVLLLPLSSTCHPLQRFTSAYSYPSYYCQQLKDEYPLSCLEYCALSPPNQTPNGIVLSPEIACYQLRPSLNTYEHSLSVHKTSSCQNHTKTLTGG